MPIYDLQLDSFNGIRFHKGIDPNEHIITKLQAIKDFRKKLIYYNKNVESLSAYGMLGRIHIYKGIENIKIYCGCKTCREHVNFNYDHEKIFWELKNEEVDRLVKAIQKRKHYRDKLSVLLSTKGYELTGRFTIYPNVEIDLSKNDSWEFFEHELVIDLTPESKEEIRIYNEFVQSAFEKRYLKADGFTDQYFGFSFKKEKERFEKTLSNSIEPKVLIEYVISLIENKYDYPNCIYAEDKQGKTLQEVNQHLEESGFLKNLFPRMVLGTEIDLNKYVVTNHTLWEYTHVSEVVKFYDYLRKQLQKITSLQLKEVDAEEGNEKNKGFTTARQVLAIHYLLEYTQVRNIDSTEKARFVQFITGKELGSKKISDTNIYKKVLSPLSTDNKTLINDLQFIRGYFEKLSLSEITTMITNEINKQENIG